MVYQELARQVGARIVLQEAAAPAMPSITISEDWPVRPRRALRGLAREAGDPVFRPGI